MDYSQDPGPLGMEQLNPFSDNAYNDGIGQLNGDTEILANVDQTNLQGDNNNLPIVSTNTNAAQPNLLQTLGSSSTTARDLGTAVGTAQRQLSMIGPSFRAGQANAASGNSLGTWWQYASTTDKLIVGLGIAALVVAIYHK